MFVFVIIGWFLFFPYFKDVFLNKYYYMPFLGIIAATIANTTPAAAGIVYFPILTKFNIIPLEAVKYSLMIQAFGMGIGSIRWYLLNKNLFIKNILPLALTGGFIGCFFSIVIFPLKDPAYLKLIFNIIAFLLVQFIIISIIRKNNYFKNHVELNKNVLITIAICSLSGGLISGWIGFGIDTIFYFILTIFYKVNPAIAIVTSICIMAFISIFASILHLIMNSALPISLWYSAIPGVAIGGLFLATYVAVKLGTKNILILFCLLLCIDFYHCIWTQHVIPMGHILRFIITDILILYVVVIHIKVFKHNYKFLPSSKFVEDTGSNLE